MAEVMEVLAFMAGFGMSMLPIQDNDPASAARRIDRTTYVRIGAGILVKGENLTFPGMGSQPGLALFDINGDTIGYEDRGGHIGSSTVVSVVASPWAAITIPEYLSVSAGDDAICISHITVTASDGMQHMWTGDVARICNLPYYISHYNIGTDKNPVNPVCMWLKGRSNFAQDGAKFKGMGIHLPDFSTKGSNPSAANFYTRNIDKLCQNPPRFWMYEELTPYDMMPYFSPPIDQIKYFLQPDNQVADPWKVNAPIEDPLDNSTVSLEKARRDIPEDIPEKDKANAMRMTGTLIITPLPNHHAKELCDDEHSMGPDFVSLSDNIYCDMEHKKAYPLCVGHGKDKNKHTCFDLDSKTLRAGTGGHPHRRDGQVVPDKAYHDVVNW